MIKEPRLRFTEEEQADPALGKPVRKAEKAAAKADKAQAKIPKKQVKRTEVDPKTGKVTTKLVLEDKPRPPSKLSHSLRDAPGNAVAGKIHQEIQESEDDNVGVESAHKSEEAVETGVHLVQEGYRSHKLKPYRKAAQAERQLEKANINALYQKSLQDNPQAASNPLSRWQQKQQIKKQYAAAKRAAQSGGTAAGAAQKSGKAAKTVKEKAQQAGAYVMQHKKGFIMVLAIFLLICLLLNTMSSCSMMAQSIGSMISGTTYPSDDPELVAVEADYAAKEAALQAEIDNIESSHPGYDEYRYDLDMIGHDPHELAAYLSAVLQGYTRASAQAELERIFAAQYQLTLTEEVEVRYRTETRTDSEGNEYDVEVPYNYYILNVTLTSKPISSVALELLTPDQLEMYQVYRQTLGNKPLIFGGGPPTPAIPRVWPVWSLSTAPGPAIRRWWTSPKARWATWAASPTGAGTALPPAWSGAPALSPGATARWGYLSRAFRPASPRASPGSSHMDNGAGGIMPTSPPATPSSSIGTWTAGPIMWGSLSAPTAAKSTPWRAIPATPARSRATL